MAQAQTLHHPRGDRDDVLERTAQLNADDVRRSVKPKGRTAKLRLHERRRCRIARCGENGRR